MRVWVVRHGCAGDKGHWRGPDEERPLDDVGVRQAEALAVLLADIGIRRIGSSPTRRCRDTVAPLARRLDLPVEDWSRLGPSSDGAALLDLIVDEGGDRAVLCTHGETMTSALAALRAGGAPVPAEADDRLLGKGTVWALTVDDGTIVAFDHLEPSPPVSCAVHDPPRGAGDRSLTGG